MSRAALYCLLANVLGGATFVAMDQAAKSGLPELTFNFLRTLLSTLLFVAVAAARRELRPRFSLRDWALVLLVGGPGFALPLVLGLRGVALSTAGLGSILSLMEPVAIVPLSFLFLQEHLPRRRVFGMALGFAGALLVILSDRLAETGAGTPARAAAGAALTGNLILAVQGCLWGVYTVAAKPLVGRHPALTISTWTTVVGCAFCGLLAPLEWSALRPAALDGAARWLALHPGGEEGAPPLGQALVSSAPWVLYLGVLGSFLSVLLWNAGLKGVDASRMAIFIFLQPAVGLLLHALVGGAAPAMFAWIGFGLILGAVLLVTREEPASGVTADRAPPPPATA